MPRPSQPALELHHVALGARDVARVAGFYRDVFGLREVSRHRYGDGTLRSVWLSLGASAVLMIEHTERDRPRVEGVGAGPFLLAFRIDRSAREAVEQRLVAAGAAIESRTEHSSYARDSEGNRIAISSYPLASRDPDS